MKNVNSAINKMQKVDQDQCYIARHRVYKLPALVATAWPYVRATDHASKGIFSHGMTTKRGTKYSL